MDSFGNKKNGTLKEEGELTDDDDDGHEENCMVYSNTLSKETSRHFSPEQNKSLETRSKFGSKRKDYRRRTEPDNRRSFRVASDGGLKKYHRGEHQDFRQNSVPESYTPSKFWANRRFRASSVRPLSPRYAKSSGSRRIDSPQSQKYRGGHDIVAEGQDELERLEKEQRRIREQLKSLEEEEEEANDENDRDLESLDARSKAEDLATSFTETSNSAGLNYALENEKSDDEDIDLQELRRLALATSERHIRLMAIEPQPSLPGIPSGDVVVIPDVEPDLPEPEVVMVDDEDFGLDRNLAHLQTAAAAAVTANPSLIESPPSKKKSKKSSKLKKKGQSNANKKSNVHGRAGTTVKSQVALPSPKKSKTKRHKKGGTKQADAWIRQREELLILVMDDPAKALEKLLKFATEGKGNEKPIVTGTIKDLKRQKQIPVLSDKRAVQNFSQQSIDKKKILQEKSKEFKEQDKKVGQLQDNYEEVEMDIDSNADDEEENSNVGDDFSQAMFPVPSHPGSYHQIQQPALIPAITPSQPMQQFPVLVAHPFNGIIPPSIPPPIPPPISLEPPPPLPPHPPPHDQDSSWRNQPAELEERIGDIRNNRTEKKIVSRNLIYSKDESTLCPQNEATYHVLNNDTFPEMILSDDKNRAYNISKDVDWSVYKYNFSLDDDISRRLRLIRQNQETCLESQDVDTCRINPGLMNIFSSETDRSVLQHLIPLTGNTSISDVKKSNNSTHHSFVHMRSDQARVCDSEELHNFFGDPPAPSGKRNCFDMFLAKHISNELEKFGVQSEATSKLPAMKSTSHRSDRDHGRRIPIDRSPSPPRRVSLRKHQRSSSRDGSGSPYPNTYSRRTLLESVFKYRDDSYSLSQRSASRENMRDQNDERLPVRFQQETRLLQHEHILHVPSSSSPLQDFRDRRSSSSEGADMYEPEAPFTKKMKLSSPPPYIPTSIKTMSASHRPHNILHHGSDSEEEDPAALRNKLLAELMVKRKTTAEGLSNNTTPLEMSPRQETLFVANQQDEPEQFEETKPASHILTVSGIREEDDDEEDVLPPPVINRVSRHPNKPASLRALCEKKVIIKGEQRDIQEQFRSQTEEQNSQHLIPKGLGSNLIGVGIFEEDNDDLSKSDLEALRAYVMRSQTHAAERTQHVKHTQVKDHVKDEIPASTHEAQHLLNQNESDSAMVVSLPLSKTQSHLEKPKIPSGKKLLLNSSAPTSEIVKPSGHNEQLSQNGEPIASYPLVSSSTNTVSVHQCLPTSLAVDIQATNSVSPSGLSQMGSSFTSSSLYSQATQLHQPTANLRENYALITPQPVPVSKHHLETFPKHISAVKQILNQTSSLPPQTSSNKTQASLESSLDIQQRQFQLGLVDTNKLISKNLQENRKHLINEPINLSASINTSKKCTTVDQSAATKAVESVSHSHNLKHVDSDLQGTFLSYAERPSISSYSSQSYASVGARKYSNLHMLPVHPQVLVPVNSSSGSEDDDNVSQPEPAASAQTGINGDDVDLLLNTHRLLAEVQGNEQKASQILNTQEKLLINQHLAILKDQRAVKLLVKRAVKFLEAQLKEEEKQKLLQAELMALSHKMKTSEKFVMLLRTERDKIEKQVQLVTEKLLRKKVLYERKVKAVTSLGAKLLGPSYVPKIPKPHVLKSSQQEPTTQEKQGLTRAQEKQKLMEKEKQIAEKLRKLKEAQAEKGTRRLQDVKKLSASNISSDPKWKSQDVIRIDNDSKPDASATPRRRSLLEVLGPSTTPNIPPTPRRSLSAPYAEKENIVSETVVELKPADKEANTDWSSSFIMPSGTLLVNFCQLQREKAIKYLQHPNPTSASACTYPGLSGLQTTMSVPKLRLQVSDRQQRHSQYASKSFNKTSHAYSSPLLMFRSYRFNSYFRTKENLCLQSSTYSNKINPNTVLCPYDLQGTCSDDSCQQQHPTDYKFSDHELLEDIVSYCPSLTGAREGSSPEEVEKCIVTFVDSLLSKHKGKMTIEDLCLWLLSQVNEASGKRHPHTVTFEQRIWRPPAKEETGLSLALSQQLNSHKVETINMDKKVTDRDTVVNEEDMRYFAADLTELLLLEASIMEDQTNIELWQKLASKKLYDPNKSPKECLEQALSVLSRGLEVNRNDPELWLMYLTLYRRHSDVKDFPEFCQMALEYAPSYALWFLYLDSLKTFSEKDETTIQVLQFLCNIARDKRLSCVSDVPKSRKALKTNDKINEASVNSGHEINNISDINEKDSKVIAKDKTLEKVSLSDTHETTDVISEKMKDNGDETSCEADGEKNVGDEADKPEDEQSRFDWKTLSHQMLEMVIYKTCLNLQTGTINMALYFLQLVLELKKSSTFTLSVGEFLTNADHLVLWLVYIHVLEWKQLPQHLYSMANQNPGRLMVKENITLPWSSKAPLHNEVSSLIKLHDRAAKVWECSKMDEEAAFYYVKLVQSQLSLLVSQGRHSEAVTKCKSVLSGKPLVDIWLTLADLLALCQDKEAVKNVFIDALSLDKNNPKLHFYQCMFLYQQGESESALMNLEQFAVAHFDIISRNPLHCDPGLLFGQLLKQQESFSLQAAQAQVKKGVSDNVHKNIFMWLCYSLWMEIKGRDSETVEVFERSLTHACAPNDLVLVWYNYIAYMIRSKTPPKEVRDIIIRSIISVPTKFPVPLSPHSSAVWVNYYYINQLVEAWLAVLSPVDTLDFMELCLVLMPNNIQLLLRALDLCLNVKETRRAYSWCRFVAVQTDRPANLAFWKTAVALAQVEGTAKEVEHMMIGCVETMPLAVSGWKDFLLFEVTRQNTVAVQKLLTYCQQLELNIEGFATTLSAS